MSVISKSTNGSSERDDGPDSIVLESHRQAMDRAFAPVLAAQAAIEGESVSEQDISAETIIVVKVMPEVLELNGKISRQPGAAKMYLTKRNAVALVAAITAELHRPS